MSLTPQQRGRAWTLTLPKDHWLLEPGAVFLPPGPSPGRTPYGTRATSLPQPHDRCPCSDILVREPCPKFQPQPSHRLLSTTSARRRLPPGTEKGEGALPVRGAGAGCGARGRLGRSGAWRGAAPGLTRQKNVCAAGRGLGSQPGLIWPPPTGWEVGALPVIPRIPAKASPIAGRGK